jgi:hypothetical protein
MFLLILFVFLGCPMDSNLSKDKDQNGQPGLVPVKDDEVDFKAITEKLSKNQTVKLGNSSGKEVNVTIPGTFTIPAGKELIIGDKVTLDLTGETALINGTLTAEKGAIIRFASDKPLELLDAGMLKIAGKIEAAGTITFQESIKNRITLINNGKFIATPNSTVSLMIGNAPSIVVIGTGGSFTWEKDSGGGVELRNENGFILTDGTKLALAKEHVVASTDTIKVDNYATLVINNNGILKGTDAKTTLIISIGGEVAIRGGTANFFQSDGIKSSIFGYTVMAGTYKWDPSINKPNGGWKHQDIQ